MALVQMHFFSGFDTEVHSHSIYLEKVEKFTTKDQALGFSLIVKYESHRVSPHCAGVFLPKLCEAERQEKRRGMAEIRSWGAVASAPTIHAIKLTVAPALSPY